MKNIYEIILESLNDDAKKMFEQILAEYHSQALRQYEELLKSNDLITKEQLFKSMSKIFDGRTPIEEFINRTNQKD